MCHKMSHSRFNSKAILLWKVDRIWLSRILILIIKYPLIQLLKMLEQRSCQWFNNNSSKFSNKSLYCKVKEVYKLQIERIINSQTQIPNL